MPVVRRSPEGGEELLLFCFHLSSVFEQALGHFDVPHASGHVQRGQVVLRPEGRQSVRDNIKAELVTFAGTMYIFPTPLPTVASLLRGKARPNWIKNEVARSALLQGKKGSTEQPSPPLTPQKATATITLLCCTLVQRAMLYSRIESEDKRARQAGTLLRASMLALKLISPVTMSRLPWNSVGEAVASDKSVVRVVTRKANKDL